MIIEAHGAQAAGKDIDSSASGGERFHDGRVDPTVYEAIRLQEVGGHLELTDHLIESDGDESQPDQSGKASAHLIQRLNDVLRKFRHFLCVCRR